MINGKISIKKAEDNGIVHFIATIDGYYDVIGIGGTYCEAYKSIKELINLKGIDKIKDICYT